MASAASTSDKHDSSEDSEDEQAIAAHIKSGNMELVRQTLHGIAAHSLDEGAAAIGRYAKTIRIGKDLWQPRTEDVCRHIREPCFEGDDFPLSTMSKLL